MISLQSAPSVNQSSGWESVAVGRVPTPLGDFGAVFTPRGLAQLTFELGDDLLGEAWVRRFMPGARARAESPELDDLRRQLTDYFEGRLREFRVRLDLRGTPFQLAVWNALREIGYGQVRSYGDVARAIGRPRAVRAVGAANGRNPVAIIVPCHRVIGSNGTLTGYGGGIDMKQYLLKLEGATL